MNHLDITEKLKKDSRENGTADTRVRTEAGNIVVEAAGDVVALVVVEPEEQARATEVVVGAEEYVAVGILSVRIVQLSVKFSLMMSRVKGDVRLPLGTALQELQRP